jgi:hypothetical protein
MELPPEPVRRRRRLLAASTALGMLILAAWVSYILSRATAIPMSAAIATEDWARLESEQVDCTPLVALLS